MHENMIKIRKGRFTLPRHDGVKASETHLREMEMELAGSNEEKGLIDYPEI